jgi:hypothetical protein
MPIFFPQRACFSGAQVQENEYCDGKNCVLIWNPTRHDAPMQVLIHWEDWHLPLPPKNCVQIRGIGQQTQKQQLRELCSRFLAGMETYPNNSHIGWRPRMASKTVKLQRPASGHRVQSLLKFEDVAASYLCLVQTLQDGDTRANREKYLLCAACPVM